MSAALMVTAVLVADFAAADEVLEPGDEFFSEPDRSPASVEADQKAAKAVSDAIISMIKAESPGVRVTRRQALARWWETEPGQGCSDDGVWLLQ